MAGVIKEIAGRLGVEPADAADPARVWLVLAEALAAEGLVVLVKVDGERRDGEGRYTVVVSRPSDGAFVRADARSLMDALERVCSDLLAGSEISWPGSPTAPPSAAETG